MAERTGDHQAEVLSDLLDLQAELRGETRADAPPPAEPDVVSIEEAAPTREAVTVATSGLEVSVTPSGAAVTERLTALNERLARLEASLATMTERIDEVESQPPDEADATPNADAPWRSFLDLQKIVADRLDGR
jgi:hypothetical protein